MSIYIGNVKVHLESNGVGSRWLTVHNGSRQQFKPFWITPILLTDNYRHHDKSMCFLLCISKMVFGIETPHVCWQMPYFQANKTSKQILGKYSNWIKYEICAHIQYIWIESIYYLPRFERRQPLFPYYDVRQGHQIW